MTAQKAIGWMKALKKIYKPMPKDVNDACDVAISALKKQLPKKPVMTEDKQFALCPCCNGKGLLDKQMYCDCCGQRLDWSDAD